MSNNHIMKPRVERMRQGLLVIGTDQIALAVAFARERLLLPDQWACTSAGRYRKVPGQWSDWELYAVSAELGDNTRGSFLGVCFYFEADS